MQADSAPSQNVRWAIVGLGDIVKKRVAGALSDQPASEVEACVTRDPQAHRDLLDAVRPRSVYTHLDAALEDPRIDAFYIATPVFLHRPQTIAALSAGRHVLVEKPMALSASEAALMCQAARRHQRRLAVAYYRRFWDRFRFVKKVVDQRRLGRLVLVTLHLYHDFSPPGGARENWRLDAALSGGGGAADVGSHRLDLLAWWFGMPERLVADTATLAHEYEVDDATSVLMVFPDGLQATITVHWSGSQRGDRLEIVGTAGRLTMDPLDSGPIVVDGADGSREQFKLDKPANAHFPLIDQFARAIAEGSPLEFDGQDGAQATRLLDAIYMSSRNRGWVDLATE